jgi:hypothetical protein
LACRIFTHNLEMWKSRGSSVSTMTGPRTGRPGFNSR